MNILVFNCGSSSLTYKIFHIDKAGNPEVLLSGKAHRVGVKGTEGSFVENKYKNKVFKEVIEIKDHRQAAGLALKFINENKIVVDYAGNRFVHGGNKFDGSVIITKDVFKKLVECLPLAPIHNPVSLSVISETEKVLVDVPQYVAFDSAFHCNLPEYAYRYALPQKMVEEYGFRKYGFHGLSYSYVTVKSAETLGKTKEEIKIVACHLGTGGASVAAIKNGYSVDTSMGYSPLPGLVMSTRCGDIDPMLAIYMMVRYKYKPDDLMDVFNKKSGLLGVSGISGDIRDVIDSVSKEETQGALAFKMYIHRLKKYIGSYIAVLGGIDVLVFTDDIGVHNSQVRSKVCERMEWAGIEIDENKNKEVSDDKVCLIDKEGSRVHLLTVPTEEELVICLEGIKIIKGIK